MHSDDQGATWSETRWISTDEQGQSNAGMCMGLTYLGGGKLVISSESHRFFSEDYGETWEGPVPLAKLPEGRTAYCWDPMFVDRDRGTGKATLLGEARSVPTGRPWGSKEGFYTRAMVWFSDDEGRSWSDPLFPPPWQGISETALIRAANGDLVAGCRTPMPKRFADYGHDHYCGVGISISRDNGKTWSNVNRLYEYGRHHPSFVLMPDGKLVMVYVVRMGYPDTAGSYPWPSYVKRVPSELPGSGDPKTEEPFPQYGIEAVVSHDNGQTWDLDHRYMLVVYPGSISTTAENVHHYWDSAVQGTSSLVMPDGSILTAFGSGYRVDPDPSAPQFWPRDIGLIQWRLNPGPVNSDSEISRAADDSDLRNKIDPYATRTD
jgi:hypothetical protein